jgi:hypothetical protein
MPFTTPSYHQEVWDKIRAATEVGHLGFSSKTPNPQCRAYNDLRVMVTCVYTFAFPRARLSYKRDADTLDDIYGSGAAT